MLRQLLCTCVRVCVCEREGARVCVCVCVCVCEREEERAKERDHTSFHMFKRSPRHSKDLTIKSLDLEIQIFEV